MKRDDLDRAIGVNILIEKINKNLETLKSDLKGSDGKSVEDSVEWTDIHMKGKANDNHLRISRNSSAYPDSFSAKLNYVVQFCRDNIVLLLEQYKKELEREFENIGKDQHHE